MQATETFDSNDLLFFTRQHAEIHSQLLKEDEGENCLRRQSNECWHVAFEEAEWTELRCVSDDVPDSIELSRLGIHGASFQHVEWLSE